MHTGIKVSGLYLGEIPFTGTIVSRRNITTNNHSVEHIVQLDSPVVVFGESRDRLTLITQDDGAASAYTRQSCHMQHAGAA